MAKNEGKVIPQTNEDVQGLIFRNNFYRDNYRRIMLVSIVLVLIIIGQIAFLFFIQGTRRAPTYYAATHDGKQIQLSALSEPNLSTKALLEWVKTAATNSYSFNFVNWNEALTSVKPYYTPQGYENFINALKQSGSLEDVKNKKLVVSAVPTGTPVILKEGMINNQYSWQIQFTMLLSYQSANEVIKQNITVTLLVVRVPTIESEKGIGIAQFVMGANKD